MYFLHSGFAPPVKHLAVQLQPQIQQCPQLHQLVLERHILAA